jgi:hypothetical protein
VRKISALGLGSMSILSFLLFYNFVIRHRIFLKQVLQLKFYVHFQIDSMFLACFDVICSVKARDTVELETLVSVIQQIDGVESSMTQLWPQLTFCPTIMASSFHFFWDYSSPSDN